MDALQSNIESLRARPRPVWRGGSSGDAQLQHFDVLDDRPSKWYIVRRSKTYSYPGHGTTLSDDMVPDKETIRPPVEGRDGDQENAGLRHVAG
jgi:hypothetical protein